MGVQFYPLDARPEEIFIDDIAHALSNQCRFAGHSKKFYSVAEHSVRVSYECEQEFALWGLMHDASEAYLVDVPRPVKYQPEMDAYRETEKRLMAVIAQKYGLSMPEPPNVKQADKVLLLTEQRDLMGRQTKPWKDKATPLLMNIVPWSPTWAERRFLERFKELTEKQHD